MRVCHLLFLTLEKKQNVRLQSITDALFNSTMPFYFTLGWAGRGGGVMEGKEWIRKITTWQLCSQ